ncbi:MAG: D-alanine--D-alanine ligase [Planctomycetes bacterium]|nr:D-alanine--D-alanine ligase [Planctomycetota bacterium]
MAITKQIFNLKKLFKKETAQKLAVTVLAGGPSGEREVSLESGKNVAAALSQLGYTVHLEDINPGNLGALAREVDCVFIALHGAFGEDGAVQQILETRGLAYCGSGPEACELAMDKFESKKRFIEAGLPTPRFTLAMPETIRETMAAWSLPVVVKPSREGSSLHCYIVRDFTQFRPALDLVIEKYGSALIEEYIPGMELTVSILGNEALPAIEIRTRREFYDYQAKYVDEDTEYRFEIDLPEVLLTQIRDMSLRAHQALGCRDFSRVDWRVNPEEQKAYLLELNVIPGLTTHSLLPKAAAKSGYDMPALCRTIVDMAIARRYAAR